MAAEALRVDGPAHIYAGPCPQAGLHTQGDVVHTTSVLLHAADVADNISDVPRPQAERRWPMASAVLVTAILHEFLPGFFRVRPHWVYPAFIGVFLVILVIGDPGRIDRDRRWLRVTTDLMIAVITLVNGVAAGRLVAGILHKHAFESATQLLLTGAIIWVSNVIAFALWYWDLDGGGSASRAMHGARANPAFVFPEMNFPEFVPATWSPHFFDYLAMSFNQAMAFSPTDVTAIKHWAKALTALESLISLLLAALVVARAINIL